MFKPSCNVLHQKYSKIIPGNDGELYGCVCRFSYHEVLGVRSNAMYLLSQDILEIEL